jgi:hypothetical protein
VKEIVTGTQILEGDSVLKREYKNIFMKHMG